MNSLAHGPAHPTSGRADISSADRRPGVLFSWHYAHKRRKVRDFVGNCGQIRQLRELIRKFAPHDVPLLLIGEESTGKRLIGEIIHELSNRRDGPFVLVDCAASSTMALAVELFGCSPGVLSGTATGFPGKFELAKGGTLFLDHFEAIPKVLQGRLLHALERQTVERLGSFDPIPVRVRIVAAIRTGPGVGSGEDRIGAGLLARLSGGFPLVIPPLRARDGDIPLLGRHFLQQANRAFGKAVRRIRDDAAALLEAYQWPGNTWELQNCIWSAVRNGRREITPSDLGLSLSPGPAEALARHKPALPPGPGIGPAALG